MHDIDNVDAEYSQNIGIQNNFYIKTQKKFEIGFYDNSFK